MKALAQSSTLLRLLHARSGLWLVGVVSLLVALAYFPSLDLPLSFDDAWTVRLTRAYTVLDLFTRTGEFGYYRPFYLAYSWVAARLGAEGGFVLHVVSLLGHAGNALLLVRTAQALGAARAAAFIAGVLFAAQPLAVQAVAIPAGLNHVLALLFVQLSVLAYGYARERRRLVVLFLALFAFVGAVLANEIGIVATALWLLWEIAHARGASWLTLARRALVPIAAASAYLIAYALIPKGESPPSAALTELPHKLLIAAQLLAYPAVWVFGFFFGEGNTIVALALSLTLILVLGARVQRHRAFWIGAAWWAITCAPPVARLPVDYLENAPRALYVATAGASVLWASIIVALASHVRRRGAMVAAQAVLCVALAAQGVAHVREQIAFLQLASEPVRAVATHGQRLEEGAQLAAINVPEWISVPRRRYPLFAEGAILLAPYVYGSDLVLANTGLRREVRLFQQPVAGDPARPYNFQLFGESLSSPAALIGAHRVLLTTFPPQGPRTRWVGGFDAHTTAPPLATFGNTLTLHVDHVQPCADGWRVMLRWQRLPAASSTLPPTLSAFVHVLDAQGNKITQHDGTPLAGLMPFNALPTNQDTLDQRMLHLDSSFASPAALLHVGVYDYTTGERLSAHDAQGQLLEGNALTVPIALPNPQAACD